MVKNITLIFLQKFRSLCFTMHPTEKLRKRLWTVPKKLDTICERKSEKVLFFVIMWFVMNKLYL